MPLEGNKAIKHNSTAHYKLWFNKRLSTERGGYCCIGSWLQDLYLHSSTEVIIFSTDMASLFLIKLLQEENSSHVSEIWGIMRNGEKRFKNQIVANQCDGGTNHVLEMQSSGSISIQDLVDWQMLVQGVKAMHSSMTLCKKKCPC